MASFGRALDALRTGEEGSRNRRVAGVQACRRAGVADVKLGENVDARVDSLSLGNWSRHGVERPERWGSKPPSVPEAWMSQHPRLHWPR